MKKLLSIIFALIITLPALALDITVTVWDSEEKEPLIGATVLEKGTQQGTSTDAKGIATLTVQDNATIVVSYIGKQSIEKPASPTMRFDMKTSNTLNEANVVGCPTGNGIKTTECQNCKEPDYYTDADADICSPQNCSGECVITACYTPCYALKDGKCEKQNAKNGEYIWKSTTQQCTLECNTAKGYVKSSDGLSCIKDCLSEAKQKAPLATKAEYDSNGKCMITQCKKKDGKKYVPSDDGQQCEVTERECDKTTDKKIWPEHATAASYKDKKCIATECEDGYEQKKGECISVNGKKCDGNDRPEHSTKSHQDYDSEAGKTACLVDECEKGYKPSNDLLSCIPESALEDPEARMKELKDNAQAMKDNEQSQANKLLGAAGMASVGLGGMAAMSALAEQNADQDAEQDMKAYLATFTCDYGQGRNIKGGETGIELPGGNDLIQYVTQYKQLATELKASKEALGMMPGIESETIFDSATTGLYDDVGIGTQRGAFTSLSRALQDENSADAAEWQAQKDATAKKLKTGATVAVAGAVGTAVANIAINHGKGDKSGKIWNEYEDKKRPTIDISPERKPCPAGSPGTYIPNCICPENAYFNIHSGCVQCGANQVVNATKNGCECDTEKGYYADSSEQNELRCVQKPADCTLIGPFTDPKTCKCQEGATQKGNTCECKQPGYKVEDGRCTQCALNGLVKTDNPCECVDNAENISGTCKCKAGYIPDNQGGCQRNEERQESTITVEASASSDSTFEPGMCTIADDACTEIINKLKQALSTAIQQQDYNTRLSNNDSDTVTIQIAGYTDRQGFKADQKGKCLGRNVQGKKTSDLNKELSEKRAWAMHDCIDTNKTILFGNAQITFDPSKQSDMGKGQDACTECDNNNTKAKICEPCRKVDVTIKINTQ